MSVFPNM